MSWVCTYPLATNRALYWLTKPYFTLYTVLHPIGLQCQGGSTKPHVFLASSARFLSPWTIATWHPVMPPHSFPALLPLLSCTHNNVPCIHHNRTGSPCSCGESIRVTSHFPISGPSWPYLPSTLEVPSHSNWCQILLDPMHLYACRNPASSSSPYLCAYLLPCTGSA